MGSAPNPKFAHPHTAGIVFLTHLFDDWCYFNAGILAGRGKVYLLHFLSIPSPVSPFFSSFPHPFPPTLSTLPFLLCCEADRLNTAKNLRQRCKLSE